jgi:hypothetical protein
MKRMSVAVATAVLVMNMYGCVAMLAGGAAGAGTAAWLSQKLTQQFDTPYEPTIKATEKALQALHLPINKEEKTADVTQIRSQYSDGKDIWIDIRMITSASTKVEVRVGAVNPDKAASEKILKKIERYL